MNRLRLLKVLTRQELATVDRLNKLVAEPHKFTPHQDPVSKGWRKPKFSQREQAMLRKARLLTQAHFNYNCIPPHSQLPEKLTHPPLRTKLPKLTKDQRMKPARLDLINEKLKFMDQTILNWKKTKAADKLKLKSDLPY